MSNQTREDIIRGTPLPESKIIYQFQWNGGLYLPHIWHDISNQELLAAVKADPAQYQLRAVVPVDVLLNAPVATVASVRADLAEAGCAQRVTPNPDGSYCVMMHSDGSMTDMSHAMASASQAVPSELAKLHENDDVRQAVADGLRGLWGCGRVWSAWNIGTMTEEDFYAADESDECIDQMIHSIARLFASQSKSEPAAPDGFTYEADEGTIAARRDGELMWHAHIYANHGSLDEEKVARSVVSRLDAAHAQAPAERDAIRDQAKQWISVDERVPSGRNCLAVYENRGGSQFIIRAMYVEKFQIEAQGDDCDTEINDENDTEYLREGWYELIDNWGEYSSVRVCEGVVTHWMPLPPAPSHPSASPDALKGGSND